MSDIEEDEPTGHSGSGTGERKWYGSLEGKIKEIEEHETSKETQGDSPEPMEGLEKGDYMELDEPEVLDEKKKMLEEFERKRRARMITVPTDDHEVRMILRQRGEPICLFAEGPADRRNRLKDFLSRLEDDSKQKEGETSDKAQPPEQEESAEAALQREETWYHRGPPSLREARMFLVNFSVPRARARLKKERIEKEVPETTRKARKQDIQNKLRSFSLIGSQNADSRPISYCSFSPNGSMLATSSWSGMANLWSIPDCKNVITFKGHQSYVDCIEWHPGATLCIDPSTLNLVSSGRDGTILLWNLKDSDPIDSLPKLEGRVSRVKFHPSGRFIGACVHDNSWRLWDLQCQEEVLFQEGHSKAVYCLDFQKDGALCATGGMDCFGRVWDLRTGRCVMFLSGHIGSVLSVDWSPDSYHLVTGSEDNTARVWDVRARKCVYTIPAHTSLLSGVSYDPNGGQYIVTCSYDNTVKLWSTGSYQPLRTLEGHDQKVMGVGVDPSGKIIATCSFDRTFKLWSPDK